MRPAIVCLLAGVLGLPPLTTVGAQDPLKPRSDVEPSDTARRIHTGLFSIIVPSGWTATVADDSTRIHCERTAAGFPGLMSSQSGRMDAALVTAPSDGPTDPTAVARAYFDREEGKLAAVASLDPKNTGAGAKRKSTTVGAYVLQYLDGRVSHITRSGMLEEALVQHYLYFPPDFGSRHEYFAFVIEKVYFQPEGFRSLKEIQSVIKSFQDERPAAVSARTPLTSSQGKAGASTRTTLSVGSPSMRVLSAAWSGVPARPATLTVEPFSGWTIRAPMQSASGALGVGVVGGLLYAVGGSSADKVVGTVEVYDPVSDKWSKRAPMPTPRSGLAVGVINGVLYAVGGRANNDVVGTLEAYDPATNRWTTKAPMRNARGGLGVGIVGGILYAVGGTNRQDLFTAVEAYDPSTNTWVARTPLPTARMGVAVDVVNGILYAVGGADKAHRGLGTVEAYDPISDSWSTKADMPTARFAPGVGVISGVLYVVGGYDRPSHLAVVEAYDPATDTWSSAEQLPQSRILIGAGVVDGLLYAVGGLDSSQHEVATVEAFIP